MTPATHRPRIVPAAGRRLLTLALLAAAPLGALLGGGATAATAATPPRSALQLIAEPRAGVAPFLALIRDARSSVDLTMYELFDRQIEYALAADASRGLDVRVLLNGGYYHAAEATNAQAYTYLRGHGVHVRYSPTYFALTHQKTLTVDGRRSAIMTLNFDGRYASTRDYAVLDTQPADVNAIEQAFDADYSGRRLSPSPGTGDLLWSPGAQTALLALVDSAKKSIELEDEEMDYPAATAALCAVARHGVRVDIVMTAESRWDAALATLRRCGASLHLYHGQRYYIHAKLLIVDGRQALVSSQNLSLGSLGYNRELGIAVTDPAIVTQLSADFASDYAGHADPAISVPARHPFTRTSSVPRIPIGSWPPNHTRNPTTDSSATTSGLSTPSASPHPAPTTTGPFSPVWTAPRRPRRSSPTSSATRPASAANADCRHPRGPHV